LDLAPPDPPLHLFASVLRPPPCFFSICSCGVGDRVFSFEPPPAVLPPLECFFLPLPTFFALLLAAQNRSCPMRPSLIYISKEQHRNWRGFPCLSPGEHLQLSRVTVFVIFPMTFFPPHPRTVFIPPVFDFPFLPNRPTLPFRGHCEFPSRRHRAGISLPPPA